MRMQQELQVKEHRWTEETLQRWRQLKGEDRSEMKKEARRLSYTLLNGSTWSTDKIHEMIQRKVRYFFRDSAQIEEGGNGGTVQQRSQGKIEICS